ncbi:MAG: thioredoxin family protein [Saprospiraceae bacterium]
MALTESNMLPLGTRAPGFKLLDTVSGENLTLEDLQSDKATVIMFICNHCPYVLHVNPEILRVAHDYIPQGVSFIAISSNDIDRYPADSPEKMKEFANEHKFPFVYLYDESQSVAKDYDAACTPDFYVFDGNLQLVYRGRLDHSRPQSETPLTGEDLRSAMDAVLSGNQVNKKQYPSAGCSIKWKR